MKGLSLIKVNSGIREHVLGNKTILLLLQVTLASKCPFTIFIRPRVEIAICFLPLLKSQLLILLHL